MANSRQKAGSVIAALAQPTTTTASLFGYTPQYAPLEQIQGSGAAHR